MQYLTLRKKPTAPLSFTCQKDLKRPMSLTVIKETHNCVTFSNTCLKHWLSPNHLVSGNISLK